MGLAEPRQVAKHMVKTDKHELGVSMVRTVNCGISTGLGVPRIWSKPVDARTEDYGVACEKLVAEFDNVIAELKATRDRFENAKIMYELTGEIPDEF